MTEVETWFSPQVFPSLVRSQHLLSLPVAVKSKSWTLKTSTTSFCRRRSRSPRKSWLPPPLPPSPAALSSVRAEPVRQTDRQTDTWTDTPKDILGVGCSAGGSLCSLSIQYPALVSSTRSAAAFTSRKLVTGGMSPGPGLPRRVPLSGLADYSPLTGKV